eukprot:CAMPEP_0183767138 /NCGR_PEP_ID=MMETSP0739-20130205/12007_1 /TAXON_ID=385413 /ORGANISM="Thalassiosira miniscula, Strain CCMP1093" /LENGTH=101 /DNA_ID=CAMNT_0026006013 /DNA_START=338 /DNA_END=642 /DNA_ORIENTATION=-
MKRRQWEKAAEASNNGNYWQQNNVTEERQSVKIDEEREADMAHEEKSSGGELLGKEMAGLFFADKERQAERDQRRDNISSRGDISRVASFAEDKRVVKEAE